MNRTKPTTGLLLHQKIAALEKFRRALRWDDKIVLDEVLANASQHTQAASHADQLQPFETFLLAMLMEEHKEIKRLRVQVEKLKAEVRGERLRPTPDNPMGF
jgi:hypothetical protein